MAVKNCGNRYRKQQGKQRGFTLLEMMVTVLIIGIAVGVATAVLRFSPQQELNRETERLWQLFNLAQDEARSRGHIYGWQSTDNAYQFMIFNAADQRWISVTDSPLQSRTINELMVIDLKLPMVENSIKPINSADKKSQKSLTRSEPENSSQAEQPPQLLFYPNGESTPFTLTINLREKPLEKTDLSWLENEGIGRIFLSTVDNRYHE
jgi:type II secretion system protein H